MCVFSRPRRFGKSVLCSTLQELFSGNRDLFKGLWIDKNTDYSWQIYPVIYLDLSMTYSNTVEALENSLISDLGDIVVFYELGEIDRATPGGMLKKLLSCCMKNLGKILL